MKLYSYWRSSSAWRVRIALAWKGIDCEIIPVHLVRDGGEQHLPAFLARNPLAQVPVLEVEQSEGRQAVLLTQSVAILEYLEEVHPTPALLPTDPLARARTRRLVEIINSGMQPYQNLRLQQTLRSHGIEPIPVTREFIATGLNALERYARDEAGAFLVGDALTFADIMLVPQLHAARRLGVELQDGSAPHFPTLARVEAACAALPAFRQAHADAQPDAEKGPSSP
ncbi:MAG: maleylacetoacetate isomerase [Myxococcales bacterium]